MILTPTIHPFPARMAPELALDALKALPQGSIVLDPMTGSGTVARQAQALGLTAYGFDLDPLAVLISKVATTRIRDEEIEYASKKLIVAVKEIPFSAIKLPWIDGDPDAERFVNFWFGEKQRIDLRRIAYFLSNADQFNVTTDVADLLRVALSRIIVTKKSAASLADDTSHSRPHRVAVESNFDVFEGFERSIRTLRKRVAGIPNIGVVAIGHGDARNLKSLSDACVDAVLTSPPYLNAIDYMRGHRLSLIWLGHRYRDLSRARSNSIGSERRPDHSFDVSAFQLIKNSIGQIEPLPSRYHGMIERYVVDLYTMVSEVSRILKSGASATFVMGNSCLKGIFVQNSEALVASAEMVGLRIRARSERDLPSGSRYLPTPDSGSLSKRMRKEVILTFQKS